MPSSFGETPGLDGSGGESFFSNLLAGGVLIQRSEIPQVASPSTASCNRGFARLSGLFQ